MAVIQRALLTAIAVVVGLFVLLGALLPIPELVDIRADLIMWATVIGAFALILAYLSVLRVHFSRVGDVKKDRGASIFVILSALGSLVLVLWQGPDGAWTQRFLTNVLIPGESALLALTVIVLILGAMRIMRERRSMESVLFILIVCLTLLSTVPYVFPQVTDAILAGINTFAVAGMRGILLGVTLGVVLTGLRVLFGIDRPYSDE